MDLRKIDFKKYKCERTDTRNSMFLLPMSDSRSIYKKIIEFNADGSCNIIQYTNLYPHWHCPRFVNDEHKRGGNVLYENIKTEEELSGKIKELCPSAFR